MKKREWIIGLMLVATLGLAGCGDDSSMEETGEDAADSAEETTEDATGTQENTLEQADETAEEAGDSVEESTD
jgi:hypothetical protein